MITLIIKSYHDILLYVGVSAIFAFTLGLYFIFKLNRRTSAKANDVFSAIAGEDIMVTQLDLARAYIETEKKILAKQILKSVMAQGNIAQQNEAKRLLATL